MDELMDTDDDGWLNVADALKALRSSDDTQAPKNVEDAIWKRISGYVRALFPGDMHADVWDLGIRKQRDSIYMSQRLGSPSTLQKRY